MSKEDSIVQNLLSWYQENKRDLPWRKTSDVYSILVSEIMLQQTQVSTVIPYYQRWMERFPSFETLALATENEVFQYWQGLGYYRRARALHQIAKLIVEQGTPKNYDEWILVPGIGPYTAAAVTSIAYKQPEAAVDTNVRRVFNRVFYTTSGELSDPDIVLKSKSMMSGVNPSNWNQALMELGALLCTANNPKCEECTLNKECNYWKEGIRDADTLELAKKKVAEKLQQTVYVLIHNNKIGFLKEGQSRWWSGLTVLPHMDSLYEALPFPREILEKTALIDEISTNYSVTKYRVYASCKIMLSKTEHPGLDWYSIDKCLNLALPNPMRKILNKILNSDGLFNRELFEISK